MKLVKAYQENYHTLNREAEHVAEEISVLPYENLLEKFGQNGVFELTKRIGRVELHFGIKLVREKDGELHIDVDPSGLPTLFGIVKGAVCVKKPH